MPPLARRTVLAVAAIGLCGFRPLFQEGPQGPDHPDDARWVMFHGVKVITDLKRGQGQAEFPADLKSANGRVMEIGGYMLPLETEMETNHFILTRRSSGCPFCPPNEANEALEVFTTHKVHYDKGQIFVKGRLTLIGTSDQGLYFRLEDAQAV